MALGARSVFRLAVKGTSWSHLLDYLSPALFDVMPARELITQAREMMSNRSDAAHFADTRTQVGQALGARGIDVHFASRDPSTGESELSKLGGSQAREVGQRVLEIYFGQLFQSDRAVLDLRAKSLVLSDRDRLHWHPSAIYVLWAPEFLQAIRDLYTGHYLDDQVRFGRALAALGMEGSADVLIDLLSQDDPRDACFESAALHANLHEVFVSYRDRGIALHRNFLPLGVYLICLYDCLEQLGGRYDIRAAVERAQDPAPLGNIANAG